MGAYLRGALNIFFGERESAIKFQFTFKIFYNYIKQIIGIITVIEMTKTYSGGTQFLKTQGEKN